MGKLMRATRNELEELSRDPLWWDGFLDRVGDVGIGAVPQVGGEYAWSWSALRRWIREDEKREGEFQAALRDFAERGVLESLPIADAATPETVGVAKLRGDRRIQVAGKLDGKWSDRMEMRHSGLVPTLVIERGRGVPPRIERDVTPVAEVEQISEDEI